VVQILVEELGLRFGRSFGDIMRRGQLLTSINVHSFQLPCALTYRRRDRTERARPIDTDMKRASPPQLAVSTELPVARNSVVTNKRRSIKGEQHKRAETLARLGSMWGRLDYEGMSSIRALKWDSFQYYMSKNSPWTRVELWETLAVDCVTGPIQFPDMP